MDMRGKGLYYGPKILKGMYALIEKRIFTEESDEDLDVKIIIIKEKGSLLMELISLEELDRLKKRKGERNFNPYHLIGVVKDNREFEEFMMAYMVPLLLENLTDINLLKDKILGAFE